MNKLEGDTPCPYCKNTVHYKYQEDNFAQSEKHIKLTKPRCLGCGKEVKSFDKDGAICEECWRKKNKEKHNIKEE